MRKKNRMLVSFASLVIATGCIHRSPGTDPRGESLKLQGDRIASAVMRYAKEKGGKPSKLADLFPKYLDFTPSSEFFLEGKEGELSVVIRYKPSWPNAGQVICSRSLGDPRWECVGHY